MSQCPKCKKEMDSFHRYFIMENKKVVEVCKTCYRKQQVFGKFSRMVRQTKVVD